jgi:hypothetical protein
MFCATRKSVRQVSFEDSPGFAHRNIAFQIVTTSLRILFLTLICIKLLITNCQRYTMQIIFICRDLFLNFIDIESKTGLWG